MVSIEELINSTGNKVKELRYIPEGKRHDIFEVTLEDGNVAIARFKKVDYDFVFDGELSLERESYLNEKAYSAGLPTPKIIGNYHLGDSQLLLTEKSPGLIWNDFMKNKNYSLSSFLDSVSFLAGDLAKAHAITFDSFGNVTDKGITPESVHNFADRLITIVNFKINKAVEEKAMSEEEINAIKKYFKLELGNLHYMMKKYPLTPRFILTDIHATNFNVDENGKPSGFFDLETCQAGTPDLEFFAQRMTILSYFNREIFEKANKIFLGAYRNAGGEYDENSPINKKIEEILYSSHALTCFYAYHGLDEDPIRRDWSRQSKEILNKAINDRTIDYMLFSNMFRSKTKRPENPN